MKKYLHDLMLICESILDVRSVATLVVKNDKILILKRGHTAPWMPNKWNLPGGVIDSGESPEVAANREALEESGLRISKSHKLTSMRSDEGWVVTFYYSVYPEWSGDVVLDYENSDFAWISRDDLNDYEFIPTVKEALFKLFNILHK